MSLALRLIVALTRGRLMGRAGTLPWHVPEDLRHFKERTLGQTVVMGRRSWESLGRPLPRRCNVVVSSSLGAGAGAEGRMHDGARIFASLTAACAWIERERPNGEAAAWICGGAEIYRQTLAPFDDGPEGFVRAGLPRPALLSVTWMPEQPVQPGDVLFPYDEAWILGRFRVAASRRGAEDERLEFVDYVPREGREGEDA